MVLGPFWWGFCSGSDLLTYSDGTREKRVVVRGILILEQWDVILFIFREAMAMF